MATGMFIMIPEETNETLQNSYDMIEDAIG